MLPTKMDATRAHFSLAGCGLPAWSSPCSGVLFLLLLLLLFLLLCRFQSSTRPQAA